MEVAPPLALPAPRSRPWLVRGVVRIGRPSVKPDVALISVRFLTLLAVTVTVLAQRLQVPEVEQLVITVMGCDVVRHRGRGGDVPCQAHAAQGEFCELQLSPTLPAPGVVARTWWRCAAHRPRSWAS
jgi:hypothetical protein